MSPPRAAAPPPLPPELAETARRIDRALDLARGPFRFAAEERDREAIERQAAALEAVRANLDKALVILLLGGTGVGKSSILNAFAGAEIARVSSIRPCTEATTFYAARTRDIDGLRATVEAGDFRIEGAGPGLDGKVVVDPPDFDSTNAENRAKLLRLLDVADLILVVANRVKYRHATLFELLKRFNRAKTFAFLMNMCDDPLFGPKVLEDFRGALTESGFPEPRLFAVSALNAYEAKLGGMMPDGAPDDAAGEFAALERMINEELAGARIAEIKRANVGGSLGALVAALVAASPAPEDLAPARWRDELAALREELVQSIVRQVRIVLFEGGEELDWFLREQRVRRLDGTFGLFANVLRRLSVRGGLMAAGKRLLATAAAEKPDERRPPDDADEEDEAAARTARGLGAVQAAVRKRLRGMSRKRIKACFDQARRDVARLEERLGLRAAELDAAVAPMLTRSTADQWIDRLSMTIEREFEALGERLHPRRRAWWTAIFSPYNIVPNVFLGLAAWHFVWGFFGGEAKFGLLFGGLFVALVACIVQYLHLTRRVEEEGETVRREMLEACAALLQREIGAGVGAPVEQAIAAAGERARAVRDLDAAPPS